MFLKFPSSYSTARQKTSMITATDRYSVVVHNILLDVIAQEYVGPGVFNHDVWAKLPRSMSSRDVTVSEISEISEIQFSYSLLSRVDVADFPPCELGVTCELGATIASEYCLFSEKEWRAEIL
jgi:hypothetical protein